MNLEAVVEPVISDVEDGASAHLPSGRFQANAAWLALVMITQDLTRVFAAVAGDGHRRKESATIRRELVQVPARVAASARRLRLHAPTRWRWQTGFENVPTAIETITRTRAAAKAPLRTRCPGRRPPSLSGRDQEPEQWKTRTDRTVPHALSRETSAAPASAVTSSTAVDPD